MTIKTKEMITKYLEDNSQTISWDDPDLYTAAFIAKRLKLSRNVVSQYLNDLYSEGKLIKVKSKPVYFFSKTHKLAKILENDLFDDLKSFKLAIENTKKEDPFKELIGHNSSLAEIVHSCKSAMLYPPSGLPVLLLGQTGVGKSLIAKLMYQFSVAEKVIGEDAKFVAVNCSEYANNPELFLTNLFGNKKGAYTGADKDNRGLLSIADGGVLFLDEIHCLANECQEKLFQFMDQGTYHMVGDNEKIYKASVRMIFATTEDPKTTIIKTLLRRIPFIVNLPSLSKRTKYEKIELISYFFKKEARNINKKIYIERRIFDILSYIDYPENIGQLYNTIKTCIADSYFKNIANDYVLIDSNSLPQELAQRCLSEGLFDKFADKDILSFDSFYSFLQESSPSYCFSRDMIKIYEKYAGSEQKIFAKVKKRFSAYLDELNFKKETSNSDVLCLSILRVFFEEFTRDNTIMTNDAMLNLSKLINDFKTGDNLEEKLELEEPKTIGRLVDLFLASSSDIAHLIRALYERLLNYFNIKSKNLFLLNITICLKELVLHDHNDPTVGIIISHGYSTASSMASSINQMMEKDLFEAIDMPIDVSMIYIASQIDDFIRTRRNINNLIILVDTGSLEKINAFMQNTRDISMLIINNINFKLAIFVAQCIKNEYSLEKIVADIQTIDFHPDIVLKKNKEKRKAILTVCATGISTAEKISHLLKDSLPREIECDFIEEGFSELSYSNIFDTYDIQFIVGTLDPNIEGYEFISIEELINDSNLDKIVKVMRGLLSEDEIEQFKRNILKNFSLQNLINYLTIINPQKIIAFVEDIVKNLEAGLNKTFPSNIVTGLYVHISCLIERLVTNRYITEYDDIDGFVKTHKDFIELAKHCFKKLEDHYCVAVPLSEIAYIYDYVSDII